MEISKRTSTRLMVMEKMVELMAAAFSLVAALAWNDAIQALFKLVFGDASSVYAKFFYAIIVTIIIVILGQRLGSIQAALAEKKAKE